MPAMESDTPTKAVLQDPATGGAEASQHPADAPKAPEPEFPDVIVPMFLRTQDVRRALREWFGGDGAIVMDELGNGTGARAARWCDMAVFQTWPSRGLTLSGIEIKVSRGDWARELANPAKAEALHQHCDFWWVAFGPEVLPKVGERLAEVPVGWGVIEVLPDKQNVPKPKVLRHPERQQRPPHVARTMVAALLRAATKVDVVERDRIIREQVEHRAKLEREEDQRRREGNADAAGKLFAELREAWGDDLRWISRSEVLLALRVIKKAGLLEGWGGLAGLFSTLAGLEAKTAELRDKLAEEFEAAGVPLPAHLPEGKPRRPRRA